MPKHLMIAVDWYGPYRDIYEARREALEFRAGLYMCLGIQRYGRTERAQYIGIGGNMYTRLHDRHHALSRVIRQRSFWLGEVATAEPSGRKVRIATATLDYAEWLHARFMQLPLNSKKTKALPPRSVTVLNRWWRPDYNTAWRHRPHPDWPDLIDYPGRDFDQPARMIWFGGKQRKFIAPDYAEP